MKVIVSQSLLADALDYLVGLAADDAGRSAALKRLDDLRVRHPHVRLRLLWQREEYDGSLQYDLLIRLAGNGTISLAYGTDRSLPWSLRGGHRVNERLLLRVNGVTMQLDQAIACLDFLWDEARLTDRLVDACLIRQELDEAPLEVSDSELQRAMDAFRRARALLTTEATNEWMKMHCITHQEMQNVVAEEIAVARLRKRVTETRVPEYFEKNRLQLASARIARLLFSKYGDACRAADEIRGGDNFYVVAEASFAQGLLSHSAGLFVLARRDEFEPDIAKCVFDVPPGTTVGPCATDGGYAVIRVLALENAVLDDRTIGFIERRLFAEWLEERKRSARIEWFWGNAARTAANRSSASSVRYDEEPK